MVAAHLLQMAVRHSMPQWQVLIPSLLTLSPLRGEGWGEGDQGPIGIIATPAELTKVLATFPSVQWKFILILIPEDEPLPQDLQFSSLSYTVRQCPIRLHDLDTLLKAFDVDC